MTGEERSEGERQLLDAIESLRRTAIWSRANRQIGVGIECERIMRQREAELANGRSS